MIARQFGRHDLFHRNRSECQVTDRYRPMTFRWTERACPSCGTVIDAAMVPTLTNRAKEEFVIDELYHLEASDHSSDKSRGYYFARVEDLHDNLPPQYEERFPSPEHLRKYALVHCGYRDEEFIVTDSNEHAIAAAAILRRRDAFAVMKVEGNVLRIWTAKSQRRMHMKREEFEASKTAVLDWIEQTLVGVPRDKKRA